MFITHHYAKASYFRDPACSSAHLPFTVQSCIFDGRQAVWCEQTFWIYSHFQHHIALCRVGLDFNQILLTGAEAVLEAAVICLDDRNITGWWLNTNTQHLFLNLIGWPGLGKCGGQWRWVCLRRKEQLGVREMGNRNKSWNKQPHLCN